MTKPRVLKRHHLIYYLEVHDLESGNLLGHLVDITTRGIKLVSKEQIPLNRTYILKLKLPAGYFQENEIHFEGKTLWSSNDVNPDFFDTGLEVTSLSLEERKILRKLIEQLGFND
ncbi:MAG: PilZ domain-containing protein [Proteobacteria bacterium]|nr:PilZ domain-containing protein [Pseudomonadota bacterium]MBU4297371.1 PilZ domain-containing protein [Pseudomonadota bacterium]MCG2749616.1 PilZ domain-containing protein [Desulfobulbaceae bacterium]